jgi:integrase
MDQKTRGTQMAVARNRVLKQFAISNKKPETLMDLYRRAAIQVWGGKACERISCANMEEIITILQNPKLEEITTPMLDELANILHQGRASGTVNNKLSSLAAMLKFAVQRGWLAQRPIFPWKDPGQHRIRWVKPEEEQALMSKMPDDIRAFCEILLHTGMRRGELLSLTKENIDGDFIRLWKTKNKKSRSVPMTPHVKELVEKWVPFNTIGLSRLRHHWMMAKKSMGLENDKEFVLHTLRHTAATRMLATTNNIVLVQQLLGHERIQTTLKYAHIDSQQLLEAVNKVHKVFHGPSQ